MLMLDLSSILRGGEGKEVNFLTPINIYCKMPTLGVGSR